jgi:acetyl esterase/lipase
VITLEDPFSHGGSRKNLLGDDPPKELIDLLSNDKRVTDKTPPTFLVHSADDGPVPVENSFMFAAALRRHKVPFALHVFEHGGHGYGLGRDDPVLKTWPGLCRQWMERRGFLK